MSGRTDLVSLLLDAGADTLVKNRYVRVEWLKIVIIIILLLLIKFKLLYKCLGSKYIYDYRTRTYWTKYLFESHTI